MRREWDPEANLILASAVEIESPQQRMAYLDEACCGNQELRERVDRLLGALQQAGSFLENAPGVTEMLGNPCETMAEGVGTRIGSYKLLQEIGEGGFGRVFMAEQLEPVQRKVALKIIKPGMDTRQVIARFEAERQALALMDHPNIAKVLDGGTTESGRPYFVMELIRGVPLTEFCDQNKITTRGRLELFATVCRAIQHAHQKGVIHRDIKPTNVMVTLHDGEPVPKVIDFGVAKAISQKLTEKTMFTSYGQMIGTPQYMSPEQAEMSGLDIDTRSDIYSLGVLLYELLTGGTPLTAEQLRGQAFSEMQRLIREEEPVRPSTRLSTLGKGTASLAAQRGTNPKKLGALLRGELDWIVMKALDKDRSRRYETANSFAADIQRYLNDEAVLACPPTARYRLLKFARRNKTAFATSAIVAAALILGTIVSTWQMIRASYAEIEAKDNAILAQSKASEAAQQAARALASEKKLRQSQKELRERLYASDMQLASQAYADGDIKNMNELLEKHRPAATEEDRRGFEWYHWWRAGHSYQGRIRHPLNAAFRWMAVSPDEETLAVVGYPGVLYLYDIATRRLLRWPLEVGWELDRPCFSPDGRFLVVASPTDGKTRVFDTNSWGPPTILESGAVHAIAFCQDKPLMATGGPDKITLWDWSTSIWKPLDVLGVSGTVEHLAFAPDGAKLVASMRDAPIAIWDVQKKARRPLPWRGGAIALSRDGGLLAIENRNVKERTIRIWKSTDFFADGGQPSPIRTLPASAPIVSLAFSPDGTRLVASMETMENTVVAWDIASPDGRPLATIRGHSRLVQSVSFVENASTVWSSGKDGYLGIWDLDRCQPYDTWPRVGLNSQTSVDPKSPIGYADDNTIVFLDDEGTIRRWDVTDRQLGEPLDKSHKYHRVALSDDGAFLAGVTRDDKLRVWDLKGRHLSFAPSPLAYLTVDRLAVSRDGRRVAYLRSGPPDPGIVLRDVESGKQIGNTLREASSRGWPTFSPHGKHLIVRRWYTPAFPTELFDVSDPAFPQRFAIQGRGPDNCAAFTSDGATLALGSYSYDIRLHDAVTGKRKQTLKGHSGEVWGLAFTKDGRRLVSTGLDETVRIWKMGHVPDGEWRLVSTLHTGSRVESVAVAPDGSSVAALSADGVLQVWRTSTVEEVDQDVRMGSKN